MLWKKVSTAKVRNSININQEQPTSHFQSWKIKKDHDMALKMQVMLWDRHEYVVVLNRLMGSYTSLLIIESLTDIK
jgi:hypothetical protein